jgi:GT2 family glycosyltransferase
MNGRGRGSDADESADSAAAAFARGQSALSRGDLFEARRWLERAHRIAPNDMAATLALATVLLRDRDRAAIALFEAVVAGTDAREAWFGLAAAQHAQGLADAAATSLRAVLSRYRVPRDPDPAELFTAIAAAAGAPGWCALYDDGGVATRVLGSRSGHAAVSVDGIARRGAAASREPTNGRALSAVSVAGPLLGSPIALDRIRAVEGFARVRAGGVEGWAWLPAAPRVDPEIVIRPVQGHGEIRLIAVTPIVDRHGGLARPRGFNVAAARLAGLRGMLRVSGPDGRDFIGSPLDPRAEILAAAAVAAGIAARNGIRDAPARLAAIPALAAVPADTVGPAAAARPNRRRRVAIVIPVYRGLSVTLDCLASVEATVPDGTRVIVVDDASPEPELTVALDNLAARRRITLVRNARNRGFPGSVNAGIRAAAALPGERDVVLLNSDTIATPGWLERLRAAVHASKDVGTATPFSNDAAIVSYPKKAGGNALPTRRELGRIGALAARANPDVAVEIPTAVGFCMYIRRECIAAVGLFREDVFAQGYGEENDFCVRARHLGWRHVAVPGAYVGHVGGHSFGAARGALMARNLEILERLHPGYHRLIAAFEAADPLADARRRIDKLRFADGRARNGKSGARRAVVMICHDAAGGVATMLRARRVALRAEGIRPVMAWPRGGACVVGDESPDGFPNLLFQLPGELSALRALLRAERPIGVEIHHQLGHDPSVLDLPSLLDVPYDVRVHDYAWHCPRVTYVGGDRRYCGEPSDVAVCEACVADSGSNIEEAIGVAALRARSARVFSGARRVIVPSADTATRLSRHFPDTRPIVIPHTEDSAIRPAPRAQRKKLRVCVIGAIGIEKGYDVLLACARDAAGRGLPIEFIVVGHTMDDRRMLATNAVFVTGRYDDAEIDALIRTQGAGLAFLPSIWPETWCLTLGHAWRAGLPVMAFDIGAIAERIRRTGNGWVIPLGLPAGAINNALLAARPITGDECVASDPTHSSTRARS